MSVEILIGDAVARLREMPADSVHCVVCSPPYWNLRDYGTGAWEGGDAACDHVERQTRGDAGRPATMVARGAGGALVPSGNSKPTDAAIQFRDICGKCGARRVDQQIGLENSPDEWAARLVEVFREVRRVLRPDGVLFCNVGDSYATGGGRSCGRNDSGKEIMGRAVSGKTGGATGKRTPSGYKDKDLIGQPWLLAFALRADGWYLRSEIIWAKPNPMPESVRDRPTKAHEQVFLLSKSSSYFFDQEAVREPNIKPFDNSNRSSYRAAATGGYDIEDNSWTPKADAGLPLNPAGRNARSVWTIATEPFSGADLLADYVGADGKPYRRSEDCPIHGRLARLGNQRTAASGGPSDRPDPRSFGTDGRPDEARGGEHDARPSIPNDMSSCGNQPPQSGGSTLANRTPGQSPTHCVDGQGDGGGYRPRTDGTEDQSKLPACRNDSLHHGSSETATQSSNGSHKTDLALATSPAYSASARIGGSIAGTSDGHEPSGSVGHMPENSSGPAGSGDHPSDGRMHHSAGKSSCTDDSTEICLCEQISVDHFATFPTELARRCILAGTSAKGCCPACAAPWARVTGEPVEVDGRGSGNKRRVPGCERINGASHVGRGFPYKPTMTPTTGWRATCACDAGEPIPCTVLDCFAGAGTTGLVAEQLGRNAILIELSPQYAEMARRRIDHARARRAIGEVADRPAVLPGQGELAL